MPECSSSWTLQLLRRTCCFSDLGKRVVTSWTSRYFQLHFDIPSCFLSWWSFSQKVRILASTGRLPKSQLGSRFSAMLAWGRPSWKRWSSMYSKGDLTWSRMTRERATTSSRLIHKSNQYYRVRVTRRSRSSSVLGAREKANRNPNSPIRRSRPWSRKAVSTGSIPNRSPTFQAPATSAYSPTLPKSTDSSLYVHPRLYRSLRRFSSAAI